MSEKKQQVYPLAPPSSVMPRSDQIPITTPAAAAPGGYNYYQESMHIKRRRRMKCLASITILTLFLATIILIFAIMLVRVKSPRVRLGYVRASNLPNGNGTGIMRLNMQLRIRNRNFGRYKFDNTVATLRRIDTGESVGEFMISEGRVRARSTRRINVLVDVRTINSIGNDSGVVPIRSEAKLKGKVEFLRVFKRRKYAEMNCTMAINLQSYAVQDLNCK